MACVAALFASPALLPFPSTTSSMASCSCRLRPAVVARAPRQQPRGRRALRRFDEVRASRLTPLSVALARCARRDCQLGFSFSGRTAPWTETFLLWRRRRGARARRWKGCRRNGAASEAVAASALAGRSRRPRAGIGGFPSISRSRRSEAHRFFSVSFTLYRLHMAC
jgi:hypothetical protein